MIEAIMRENWTEIEDGPIGFYFSEQSWLHNAFAHTIFYRKVKEYIHFLAKRMRALLINNLYYLVISKIVIFVIT